MYRPSRQTLPCWYWAALYRSGEGERRGEPKNMRLLALEKNILIYRALQMALFLFHAEDLKRTLVGSVGAKMRREKEENLEGGKLLIKIFQRLVREGILTQSESTELQNLIEYRNQIAHEIHHLTGDIEVPGRRYGLRHYLKLRYDYDALNRVKKWHHVLGNRLLRHYMMQYSCDSLIFEAAEKAYQVELKSLRKRIDRQMAERRRQIADRRPNNTPENIRC